MNRSAGVSTYAWTESGAAPKWTMWNEKLLNRLKNNDAEAEELIQKVAHTVERAEHRRQTEGKKKAVVRLSEFWEKLSKPGSRPEFSLKDIQNLRSTAPDLFQLAEQALLGHAMYDLIEHHQETGKEEPEFNEVRDKAKTALDHLLKAPPSNENIYTLLWKALHAV